MQETMHLQLTRETLLAIQANAPEKAGLLFEELQNHDSAVNNFIVAYYFNERRWIYEVEIDPASVVMSANGEGSFRVRYKLGSFDTAASVGHEKSEQMTVTLSIDFLSERLTLTGEERPV